MGCLSVLSTNWEGERFVLLSTLDVTVVNKDSSFNTGIRKYKGDYFNPKGHKYIEDFNIDNIPSRIFRVGGVILKQERLLVHYEEQFLLRFTVMEASEPLKLQVRPFLAIQRYTSAYPFQYGCQYKG